MRTLAVCLLALTIPALTFADGTPHYTASNPTVATTDETTGDCAYTGSVNCFHVFNSSGGPTLRQYTNGQMTVGIADGSNSDEIVYALDTSDVIHQYELNSEGSWSTTTLNGTPPTHIHFIATSFSLNGLYVIADPGNEIWHYNGTSWTDMSVTGGSICVSTSDSYLYRDDGGTLKQYNGSSWSTITTPSGHSGVNYVTCGDTQNVWLVMGDGTVYSNYSATGFTWTAVTLPSGTLKQLYAYGLNGAVVLTDNVSSDIYLFNSSGPSWNHMNGYGQNIIDGSEYPIAYFVSGSTIEYTHLFPFKISVTAAISGYYDCTGFPNNVCPTGSAHSGIAAVSFQAGGNGGSYTSAAVAPANNLNPTSYTGYTEDCDPYAMSATDNNCLVSTEGKVSCAVMLTVVDVWKWIKKFMITGYNTFTYMSATYTTPNYTWNNVDDCDPLRGDDPPLCKADGVGLDPPATNQTASKFDNGRVFMYQSLIDANNFCNYPAVKRKYDTAVFNPPTTNEGKCGRNLILP